MEYRFHKSKSAFTTMYICPSDNSPLINSQGAFHCDQCKRSYPVTAEGIALLDVVQRPEAEAFDEVHRGMDKMSDEGLEDSRARAHRYFTAASDYFDRPIDTALDLACGKGELTLGLALHENFRKVQLYAFDHSVDSLKVLSRSAASLGIGSSLHISSQDIDAMAYPLRSFDAIFGNAVLHHFLDWRQALTNCLRLLSDSGFMILTEPFVDGYLFPVLAFKEAAKRCGMKKANGQFRDVGLLEFIVDDLSKRLQNRNRPEVLKNLTDKHFFWTEDLLNFANSIDVKLELRSFEAPDFYEWIMQDFLRSYGISDPEMCASAIEIFSDWRSYFGEAYPELFSHYKYIIFSRR